MNLGDNVPVQEIVIIRRKFDDGNDAHHGGMWKIAFADFMTAMMCFFLVMWLISASDEKTLDQVATYFNPIKLPDAQRSEKSLQTAGDSGAPDKADAHKVAKDGKTESKPKGDEQENKPKAAEDPLFTDPYGVLSQIATQMVKTPLPEQGMRQEDTTQFSGGTAFRDPFDPDFRKRSADAPDSIPLQDGTSQQDAARNGAPRSKDAPVADVPDDGGDDTEIREAPPKTIGASPAEKALAEKAKDGKTEMAAADPADATALPAEANNLPAGAKPLGGVKPSPAKGKVSSDSAAAKLLEGQISATLRQARIPNLPNITVERRPEGILISITDKLNFEMFGSASAQPRPELVVAMEKVGKLLQGRQERIVVRGYTDSRPFRAGGYDNWRLSTDRAHIVHYMLARGGLPEARFERVEGYADRDPKVPNDPKAAANRRIEILLRQPMT